MEEYPVKKYDKLNRLIYVDWNGVERSINIYWDDTEKIKIKYRLWNQEAEVEAFDKNGNKIFSNATGTIVIKLPRIKLEKKNIFYVIEKKKIAEWKQKLESKKKK